MGHANWTQMGFALLCVCVIRVLFFFLGGGVTVEMERRNKSVTEKKKKFNLKKVYISNCLASEASPQRKFVTQRIF